MAIDILDLQPLVKNGAYHHIGGPHLSYAGCEFGVSKMRKLCKIEELKQRIATTRPEILLSEISDVEDFKYKETKTDYVKDAIEITGLSKKGQEKYLSGAMTMVIPSTIDGHTVTTISNHAFTNCENLHTIDFSECTTIRKIGDYAFYSAKVVVLNFAGCADLKHVGERSFYNSIYGCPQSIMDSECALRLGEDAFVGIRPTVIGKIARRIAENKVSKLRSSRF